MRSPGASSKNMSASSADPSGAVASAPGGRGEALRRACGWLDRWLGRIVEIPAAILVGVEVAVLFTGVVFRYVLDKPLVWTDELAAALFLWLCMLGAVVAQRRGGHMHLVAVAAALSPVWRERIGRLSEVITALFFYYLVQPSLEYGTDQWAIITPALGIHDSWRAGALLVGSVLMLLVALLQLAQRVNLRDLAFCIPVIVAVGAALWLGQDWLDGIGNWNLLIFFGLLVPVLVLTGTPIAFSFGLATMVYLSMMTTMPDSIIASRMDEGMSTLVLLAIPLFIFLGLLIEMTGLAAQLVNLMSALVGHFRGGLSYVLVGAMYLVSGISGSKAADMAAIAPVLLPEMGRRGKEPGEMIGLLSSSAAMAETIPPSIVLITVGSVTGVSIAGLFTGGLLPAALGALGLVAVAFCRSRHEDVSGVKRSSGREILHVTLAAIPALILPVLIRWAVVAGVCTATEVSTVGVVYTLVVALLIYRHLDFKKIWPLMVETASLSGAIMVILGCATAMAWALTQSGFSAALAQTMASMPGGGAGFLAISIPVFALLGSVLEGIPAIVLFGPLLFPVAAELNINLVHYSIVVVLSMSLGLFTPPFGIGFYQACAIGRVSPDRAMKACWPYMAAILAAAVIVAAVPWLSLPSF